jgi:hypothetical protein
LHRQVPSQQSLRGASNDLPDDTSYGTLVGALLPSLGSLGRELGEREQRRAEHLLHLVTQLRPWFAGLSQIGDGLRWLAGLDGRDPVAAGLLRAAFDQVVSGTERLLAEPDVRVMDESRVLIEIEFLLLDFAASPRRVELWQAMGDDERDTDFGFDMLRRRHEARSGVPSDLAIFDVEEYRIHSRRVHPRPADGGILAPPDPVTGLFFDAGDLMHHAFRVWTAGLALLANQGDDVRRLPGLPPMDAVDQATRLMDENNRRLGLSGAGAPTSRRADHGGRSRTRPGSR